MDLLKQIEENKKKYVYPYEEAQKEIAFINACGFQSFNLKHQAITLYEYQEEIILNLNKQFKCNFILKPRYCGISTTWLLHVIYKLNYYITSKQSIPSFVLISPTGACSEDSRTKMLAYAKKLNNNEILYAIRKNVVFTNETSFYTNLCGRNIEEIFIDEFMFFKDYRGVCDCCTSIGGKVIMASSLKNQKQENDFNFWFKSLLKMMGEEDTISFNKIYWWECKHYNQNLVWKKFETEPTIDKDGNVRCDKTKWLKKIEKGWIPTSQIYEEITNVLGLDTKELLN